MKKFILLFALVQISVSNYGQIIADHTVVDKYDQIPQQWLDEVKKMWVVTAGASHAEAYRMGCWQLAQNEPKYSVLTQWNGDPAPYTNSALRINTATWGNYDNASGWQYRNVMKDWWTNDLAKSRVKAGLQYCKDSGPVLYAILYGWSFDGVYISPGGDYDPIYNVRWAGKTEGGIDGATIWGLDDNDIQLTGNRVTMENYIVAMTEYIDYCKQNSISTQVIWSTGPVDNEQNWSMGESGYQQYLKWNHIKSYVIGLGKGYLMDYADILSYSDAGTQQTTSWTDNKGNLKVFPIIHPENMGGDAIGHIGYNGALKLGKAMWWLLARMAGWDGNVTTTSSVILEGATKSMKITINSGIVEALFDENLIGELVCLKNINGQMISEKIVNGNSCQFNVNSLPNGVYLIDLSSHNYVSEKFIKL